MIEVVWTVVVLFFLCYSVYVVPWILYRVCVVFR